MRERVAGVWNLFFNEVDGYNSSQQHKPQSFCPEIRNEIRNGTRTGIRTKITTKITAKNLESYDSSWI